MDIKAKLKTKTGVITILLFCAVSFIVSAFTVITHVYSFFAPNNTLQVTGEQITGYKVTYMENEVFGDGIMPLNRHYLMSYTDFWEFESLLSSEFSQELDISYQYSATATLLIKHARAYGSDINPVIYEVTHTLSESNGGVMGDNLKLQSDVVTIYPKQYIDTYLQFVTEQHAQMMKESTVADKTPPFTAELLVSFSCHVQSADGEINETLTSGYSVSLTSEVYGFTETGTPAFDKSVTLRVFTMPSLPVIVALVLWFSALVLGVCVCVRRLVLGQNPLGCALKRILARYGDEVAITQEPIDLSEYQIVPLVTFDQLLKLAVNMGKQIICYYNDETADFCVITDGCAYCFNLYYKTITP